MPDRYGSISVFNRLNEHNTVVYPSGKSLHVWPGTFTKATTQITLWDYDIGDPKTSSEPEDLLKRGLGPSGTQASYEPGDDLLPPGYSQVGEWQFSFEISAPNNLLGNITGIFPYPTDTLVQLIFQYDIKEVDGAAWYAVQLRTFDKASSKWKDGPVSSLGHLAAARAS